MGRTAVGSTISACTSALSMPCMARTDLEGASGAAGSGNEGRLPCENDFESTVVLNSSASGVESSSCRLSSLLDTFRRFCRCESVACSSWVTPAVCSSCADGVSCLWISFDFGAAALRAFLRTFLRFKYLVFALVLAWRGSVSNGKTKFTMTHFCTPSIRYYLSPWHVGRSDLRARGLTQELLVGFKY